MNSVMRVSDGPTTCFAVMDLMSGDPIYVSIARTGVVVKRSVMGILGAVLYKENEAYKAGMTAKALAYLYPECRLPAGFTNGALRSFSNAILHCSNAAEVSVVLNEAISRAERAAECSIDQVYAVPV
ncbi:MAG: hypothetical protein Q7U56_08845 [Humidesulfovibrio sp.]|nr:hypothetical protein [Humidesulfovibrio sp.]